MVAMVSRRGLLRAGAVGVGAGLGGCSVLGVGGEPSPLVLTVWNLDQRRAHDVVVELLEGDADSAAGATVFRREFSLAKAADTEAGEEFDEGSQREVQAAPSRPYLVRVYGDPGLFDRRPAHYHYRPCNTTSGDGMDKLFVFVGPVTETDRRTKVRFEDSC